MLYEFVHQHGISIERKYLKLNEKNTQLKFVLQRIMYLNSMNSNLSKLVACKQSNFKDGKMDAILEEDANINPYDFLVLRRVPHPPTPANPSSSLLFSIIYK